MTPFDISDLRTKILQYNTDAIYKEKHSILHEMVMGELEQVLVYSGMKNWQVYIKIRDFCDFASPASYDEWFNCAE